MRTEIESDLFHEIKGKLSKNSPLTDYTSWRTGGNADYLYLPLDLADLSHFLHQLPKNIPITWLGLGSNTLIRDGGVEGVVIVTQGGLKQLKKIDEAQIRAEAGVSSAQLSRFSARLGARGLEFMAGIPGTVGGALAMNAGCFGGETWNNVDRVEMMNREGEIKIRHKNEFDIHYRHVRGPQEEWFVAGFFSFQMGDKEKALATIHNLLEKRNNTQPTGTANCGSVFKNPPHDYAGRLIEQCGLKGKSVGGAHVSEKHANFIVNDHSATSRDIENLIYEIRAIVAEKMKVELVPEVCMIGRE